MLDADADDIAVVVVTAGTGTTVAGTTTAGTGGCCPKVQWGKVQAYRTIGTMVEL